MLEQIEILRRELLQKVISITGLSIDDVEVAINFQNQTNDSELAIEARRLNWHPDRYNESAWYTSEIPNGGSTVVYVE